VEGEITETDPGMLKALAGGMGAVFAEGEEPSETRAA